MEPGEDKRASHASASIMVRDIEETGGGPMACRSVSSFVSRDVGLWPCDAAAIDAASNLYSGVGAPPSAGNSTKLSSSEH
jgi:hypothetical protein